MKAYPKIRMVRKATLSLLLLLLVSVQALAATCDVRCSMMVPATSSGHVAILVHCHPVSFAGSENQADVTVSAVPSCIDQICNTDWAFIQPPAAPVLNVALIVPTGLQQSATPVRIEPWKRFRSHRPRRSSLFDPVITSPRV